MLYRSIYFLFHDERTVRQLIGELEQRFGLDDRQLHAIIDSHHQLTELPGATVHKRLPSAIRREKNLLYFSVGVFTLSLIAFILSLLANAWTLTALFAALVIASQLSGYLLGNRIPNAQLDRFRTGLSQGDIVLKVDAPPGLCPEIKAFIDERVPDAKTGVSNWHAGIIGL